MGIKQLLQPTMPTLNEFGIKLYSDMINAERLAIINYSKTASIYHFSTQKQDESPPDPPLKISSEDDFQEIKQRGKTLMIVTPGFNYKNFCENLYHSRREFLNHLEIISKKQNIDIKKIKIGSKSTSNPTLIDFIANNIKYSQNKAYRSSKLTSSDVIELIDYKEAKLFNSIQTSKSNHQHDRVEQYEDRLIQLQKDKEFLQNIKGEITGRALSGMALKLRAKNDDSSTKNFGIKHITIIHSENPNETVIEAAKSKNRPSMYADPILKIKALSIEICVKL